MTTKSNYKTQPMKVASIDALKGLNRGDLIEVEGEEQVVLHTGKFMQVGAARLAIKPQCRALPIQSTPRKNPDGTKYRVPDIRY